MKKFTLLVAATAFVFMGWLAANAIAQQGTEVVPGDNYYRGPAADSYSYGGTVSSGPMQEQNESGVLSTTPRETGNATGWEGPVVTNVSVAPSGTDPNDYAYYGYLPQPQTRENVTAGVLNTTPSASGGNPALARQTTPPQYDYYGYYGLAPEYYAWNPGYSWNSGYYAWNPEYFAGVPAGFAYNHNTSVLPPVAYCESIEQSRLGVQATSPMASGDIGATGSALEGNTYCEASPVPSTGVAPSFTADQAYLERQSQDFQNGYNEGWQQGFNKGQQMMASNTPDLNTPGMRDMTVTSPDFRNGFDQGFQQGFRVGELSGPG